MEYKNFIFDDNSVVIDDVLILSDIHLGRTQKQEYSYPEPEYKSIYNRIVNLIDKYNPNVVIIAGDIFQRADTIPQGSFKTLYDIQNKIENEGRELILLRGNHDEKIIDLSTIFTGRVANEYTFYDSMNDNNVCVLHGHKTPTEPSDLFVTGHLHPVVSTDDGLKKDCYLYSKDAYYNSGVLILPSFTQLSSGSDIMAKKFNPHINPIINDGKDIDDYIGICVDDGIFRQINNFNPPK